MHLRPPLEWKKICVCQRVHLDACNAGLRSFALFGEINRTKQDIPYRKPIREITIDMLTLDRMMDPVI